MMGISSAAALPNFEYFAFCSFFSSDVSTSVPYSVQRKGKLMHGNRPLLQINANRRSIGLRHRLDMWKIHSVEQMQRLVLEEEEKKKWEDCKEIISNLRFSMDEADLMLRKAFGWVHSPYWGEERKKEVPKDDMINELLDYLKGLGLSDEDLHKLLKKFPEVLGCSFSDEVKLNVGILDRDWGIDGKPLRNLILRNPKVLGYNVDCKGDCMAKCTRCWVRF